MDCLTISGIDPTIQQLRRIYDRAPSGSGDAFLTTERPKNWVLAKWTPYGWANVARFATFAEAHGHRFVLERASGVECVISHIEDGAHLRSYEVLINRLRLGGLLGRRPNTQSPAAQEAAITSVICDAHLWAARRGYSIQGRLHYGLLCLGFAPAMEDK